MKSKLKILTAVFAIGSGLLTTVNAQGSLYIYSPDTKNATTVNWVLATTTKQVVSATTSNSTGTPASVLPATSTPVCSQVLTTHNKLGSDNVEVSKLQNFLNENFGSKLNGKGFYGPVTQNVVKDLQYTYGLPVTGNQFEKTTKLVNDIKCGLVAKKSLKRHLAVVKSITKVKSVAQTVVPTTVKVIPTVVNTNAKTVQPVINTSSKAMNEGKTNLVKEYGNKNNNQLIEGKIPPGVVKFATDSATKTSFFDGLMKDWERIKENYKAYLLVFALVLALFWFLRKAATE